MPQYPVKAPIGDLTGRQIMAICMLAGGSMEYQTNGTYLDIAEKEHDRETIDGLVARTTNGGATWEIQQGQPEMASFDNIGFMELLKNPGLYDVKIRGNSGYNVGDIGNVLVTEDGGETWTSTRMPSAWRLNWIRGLSMLPSGQAVLVGASGLTFVANGKEMKFSQDPM